MTTKRNVRRMKFTTKGRADNMTKLRDQIVDTHWALSQALITTEHAKELNNAAGKVIGSAKVQIEYAAARKEKPNIPYLK